MQQAAPISSNLISSLLEQIFERFFKASPIQEQDKENLLLDLHKLLGKRLVPAALHILDNRLIIIYTSHPKTLEIAEIYDHKSRVHFVRLFVNINYCTCEYFMERILKKQSTASGPYTCQHVLALRLAIALQHSCLEYKDVSSHKLDSLLNSLLPDNPESNE